MQTPKGESESTSACMLCFFWKMAELQGNYVAKHRRSNGTDPKWLDRHNTLAVSSLSVANKGNTVETPSNRRTVQNNTNNLNATTRRTFILASGIQSEQSQFSNSSNVFDSYPSALVLRSDSRAVDTPRLKSSRHPATYGRSAARD